MRIATIGSQGALVLEERPTPESSAKVLAASINPIDLIVAGGQFPLRRFSPGDALGYSGVAERPDGSRVYFYDPEPPAGALSEQIDLDTARTVDLPETLDPTLGAALGVPGMAAHSAVILAGQLQPGQSVLVTGAAGSVGLIAGQIALAKGASKVVGVVVTEKQKAAVEQAGITPVLVGEDPGRLTDAVRAVAPEGINLVVDALWCNYPDLLVPALSHRANWVQVGSSAGNTASITAPVFRNKLVSFIGHTNFLLTDKEATDAYRGVAELAANGKIDIPFQTISLDELPEVWAGLTNRTKPGKFVVTF